MSKHLAYPEVALEATDLRSIVEGPTSGYVISANDVDTLVEVWVDAEVAPVGTPAVANLRLLPEDARSLAEQLLLAAERIERQ